MSIEAQSSAVSRSDQPLPPGTVLGGRYEILEASDEAAFVHGTVLDVDGGRTGVAVIAS